jgi:hypothetical protein
MEMVLVGGSIVEIEALPSDQVTDVSTLFEVRSEEELAELFPSPSPS